MSNRFVRYIPKVPTTIKTTYAAGLGGGALITILLLILVICCCTSSLVGTNWAKIKDYYDNLFGTVEGYRNKDRY